MTPDEARQAASEVVVWWALSPDHPTRPSRDMIADLLLTHTHAAFVAGQAAMRERAVRLLQDGRYAQGGREAEWSLHCATRIHALTTEE